MNLRVGDEAFVEKVVSSWQFYVDTLQLFVGKVGTVETITHDYIELRFPNAGRWLFKQDWLKKAVRVETPSQEVEEASETAEYTGGSVSYYTVRIENPTTPGVEPYDAECNDIIEALGMNYAEGNAFKAIWRRAAARKGKVKKGYTDGLYDAEKVVFFGERLVVQEKANASED
jgi:hypothetical protein